MISDLLRTVMGDGMANTNFISFIVCLLYIGVVKTVTIAIKDENRKKLLLIAADLQKKSSKKVDFDDVISFLTRTYEHNLRRREVFEFFCRPVAGADFGDLYAELIAERRKDEQRF